VSSLVGNDIERRLVQTTPLAAARSQAAANKGVEEANRRLFLGRANSALAHTMALLEGDGALCITCPTYEQSVAIRPRPNHPLVFERAFRTLAIVCDNLHEQKTMDEHELFYLLWGEVVGGTTLCPSMQACKVTLESICGLLGASRSQMGFGSAEGSHGWIWGPIAFDISATGSRFPQYVSADSCMYMNGLPIGQGLLDSPCMVDVDDIKGKQTATKDSEINQRLTCVLLQACSWLSPCATKASWCSGQS
jgi:hypothetical protein